jgi:anti-anti-sigma regulatory factor
MAKNTLNISKLIAPILGSRDVIRFIRPRLIESDNEIIALDFSGVEFLSRSAAHELLQLKEELKLKFNKELQFINTNAEVSTILRAVAANRAVAKNTEEPVEIETVPFSDLLVSCN